MAEGWTSAPVVGVKAGASGIVVEVSTGEAEVDVSLSLGVRVAVRVGLSVGVFDGSGVFVGGSGVSVAVGAGGSAVSVGAGEGVIVLGSKVAASGAAGAALPAARDSANGVGAIVFVGAAVGGGSPLSQAAPSTARMHRSEPASKRRGLARSGEIKRDSFPGMGRWSRALTRQS